jgi:hypothetical protein
MIREAYLSLFLGIIMITSASSMYYSTNAQLDSSNINMNNDTNQLITPSSNPDLVQNNDDALQNSKKWTIISGNWTFSEDSIHGGSHDNTTSLLHNIVLDPEPSTNLTKVTTSVEVNKLDNSTANYASIVYSFIDDENYKHAGINVYNNAIYAVAYSIDDGNEAAVPSWPGIQTDLTWTPGAILNITLFDYGSSLGLVINGTEYLTIEDSEMSQGSIGLNYGRIQDISFDDYQAESNDQQIIDNNVQEATPQSSFTTSDSQTIFLEGESLPQNSYIHLYDSMPYQISSGHVAAKFPCDEDTNSEVNVLMGQAPNLEPIEMEYISDLSLPGQLCLYHVDIDSSGFNPITDIAISNNSTDEIDFPDTSSIVISVTEISETG